ncbi:hypothetical protein MRB53_040751 [Persea americana]|nr:hypothetical protein MRB53_040751 [Persea americana]
MKSGEYAPLAQTRSMFWFPATTEVEELGDDGFRYTRPECVGRDEVGAFGVEFLPVDLEVPVVPRRDALGELLLGDGRFVEHDCAEPDALDDRRQGFVVGGHQVEGQIIQILRPHLRGPPEVHGILGDGGGASDGGVGDVDVAQRAFGNGGLVVEGGQLVREMSAIREVPKVIQTGIDDPMLVLVRGEEIELPFTVDVDETVPHMNLTRAQLYHPRRLPRASGSECWTPIPPKVLLSWLRGDTISDGRSGSEVDAEGRARRSTFSQEIRHIKPILAKLVVGAGDVMAAKVDGRESVESIEQQPGAAGVCMEVTEHRRCVRPVLPQPPSAG